MRSASAAVSTALLFAAAALAACGGGTSDADKTKTAAAGASPTTVAVATSTSGIPTTPSVGRAATPTPTIAPAATMPAGRTYTDADAQRLVTNAAIMPADIDPTWKVQTDTTSDNAQAAAADPAAGASATRCGRLLGRTLISQPPDVVGAFLTGLPVAIFSQVTVYATDAGAADCAAEAAQRLSSCVELAKTLGQLFIDPAQVKCDPVTYPQVGDGSFAVRLTGTINASGTQVDLSILIIAYRLGNVSVAVGSAHSAGSIEPSELTGYINLLNQRIGANR